MPALSSPTQSQAQSQSGKQDDETTQRLQRQVLDLARTNGELKKLLVASFGDSTAADLAELASTKVCFGAFDLFPANRMLGLVVCGVGLATCVYIVGCVQCAECADTVRKAATGTGY